VGIVTFDDLIDVAEEEVTEDFHRSAAIEPLRGSYLETPILELVQKRVPWLVALVFVNVFSGATIAAFEETIAAVVSLVFFLPLLIGSEGNQSATLTVRARATGDIESGDWWRLLAKELLVAFLLGSAMVLAVGILGIIRVGWQVAGVVSLTMLVLVLMGSLIGMSLPFLLRRLGLDPATASGPLVTSLSDIVGVLIYFSLATWLLGIGMD
jgi:magnesium transporter